MPAIFISHSTANQKLSGDIKAVLERMGFERLFLDFDQVTGFEAGINWEKRLYEELTRCHAVLLVLTPAYFTSKWCFAELTQARALGKLILPVLCEPLDGVAVLPDIQAINLVGWNADGLGRLEQRLRDIADELARGFTLPKGRPPYPGIFAFEAEDAAIYFGRDEEARAVIERLEARRAQGGARFLVIIGASGSGKSSLLKASVLPQLGRRRSQWVLLPCIRPEKAPLEALAKAIAQHLAKPETWREWHERLSGPEAGITIERLVQDVRIGDARGATLLLPIDQFEEVFTATGADERARFLGLLAALFERGLPFMVVATGRSDVLEGLVESSELVHRYESSPLAAMPIERVPRLIEGPAAVAAINVEKGLAERIVRDVESADALPLLAHALSLLYQRGSEDRKLTISDYEALGDREHGLNPIQNSVRLAAAEAMARMQPTERETAALRDAFVPHLVRVRIEDGKRVRQPALRSELPQESLRLVDALVTARLFSSRADGGETVVEVTHEALFKAWPTLDQWLTEEQAFLTDLERLRDAHENWSRAAPEHKSGELLYGLLLSRAREWLLRFPQRFVGRGMEPLRAYVAESAAAADEARDRQLRKDRFIRRGAIAAAIVFAGAAVLAGWQYLEADRARSLAQQNERSAREARNQSLKTQSLFLADLAQQNVSAGDHMTAMLLSLEALPAGGIGGERPYVPEAEVSLYAARFARQSAFQEIALLSGHEDRIMTMAISPDWTRIVTASLDHTARLWDARTGAEIATLGHEAHVRDAAFNREGTRVISRSDSPDGAVGIWEGTTGALLRWVKHGMRVDQAMFAARGTRVVTVSGQSARLWDTESGQPIAMLSDQLRTRGRTIALVSPDSLSILTYAGNAARLWDAKTGQEIAALAGPEGQVRTAHFNPDGSRIVTVSQGWTARVWDGRTGTRMHVLGGDDHRIGSARFSPDGTRIITAGEKTVRILDAATGVPLAAFNHDRSAAVNSNGSRIVTYGSDAVLWDVKGGTRIAVLSGHTNAVNEVAFSPDGTRVFTKSIEAVRLWDADNGSEIGPLKGHRDTLREARFSPDGKHLLTMSDDRTARLCDTMTGAQIAVFSDQEGGAQDAEFSPDGKIIVALAKKTLRLLKVPASPETVVIGGHDGPVRSAALSGDGKRIVTASGGAAQIFDATGARLSVLKHAGQVNTAGFSPDGSRIVTASDDALVRIWDGQTEIDHLPPRSEEAWKQVMTAAFSPDGHRIVASSPVSTRVWDLSTKSEVLLRDGTDGAFTADGARIMTTTNRVNVVFWDIATGKPTLTIETNEDDIRANLSLDGSKVVTAAGFHVNGGRAVVWDLKSKERLATVRSENSEQINQASFSPDGARIVTAANDKTARMWDVKTGAMLAVLTGHTDFVTSASFSPDGTRVVTASVDGTVRVSPIFKSTQDLIAQSRKDVLRCLTPEARRQFFLPEEPPSWCIELGKWPYATPQWKSWLSARTAGETAPLPK